MSAERLRGLLQERPTPLLSEAAVLVGLHTEHKVATAATRCLDRLPQASAEAAVAQEQAQRVQVVQEDLAAAEHGAADKAARERADRETMEEVFQSGTTALLLAVAALVRSEEML